MCLMIIKQLKTWEDARSICKSKGGDLTWIENEAEHEAIVEFYLASDGLFYDYFHIGLFRTEIGAPLQWTGGSKSQYRGYRFIDGEILHFSESPFTTGIIGTESTDLAFSVCRR